MADAIKATLVGMRFYNEKEFIYGVRKYKDNGLNIPILLKRNLDFKYGIEVRAYSPVTKGFEIVGSIGTNPNLVLEGTINGREIAPLMDEDSVYYGAMVVLDDLEKDDYASNLEIMLFEGNYANSSNSNYLNFSKILNKIGKGTNSTGEEVVNAWDESEQKELDGKVIVNAANGVSYELTELTGKYLMDSKNLGKRVYDKNGNKISDDLTNKPNGKEGIMKNMNSMFSKFGNDFAFPTSNFALSMFGGLAVKVGGSFVSYNVETRQALDVMDFVIDGLGDMILVMPVQKLEDGDIFIQDGRVFQMVDAFENIAYSYMDNSIDTLVNKTNIMGFKMYAKVINLMSNFGAAGDNSNIFANPMFLMMMMKDGDSEGSGMSNMMQMMMMSQMFQGGFKIG